MEPEELGKLFEKYHDDFLKFDLVQCKQNHRPDLNAFLMLDHLVPEDRDIVGDARHDEIFLNINVKKLAQIITEEQIRDLTRCGVRYDEETESLCMFV